MVSKSDFKKINDYLWEIPKSFRADMRVPARIYVSGEMLEDVFRDRSIGQLINVATLPGIQKYALAMPDVHEGYASPIGGVAAIRVSDGIISPGMCGYDINCLSPGTKVLLENGSYTTIRTLEKIWKDKKVRFINFLEEDLDNSEMIYFLKRYNNPSIYRIITESGEQIEATEDHPIQTQEGMKEVRLLKENEQVLIYPFKGVPYQEPSDRIILSEEGFKDVLVKLGKTTRGSSLQQILKEIQNLHLLPLKYDSWQLPYLLKIMGFVFGDGYISITKKRTAITGFSGRPEDLEVIRKDIKKIGFTASPVFWRKRKHQIKTFYREYKFSAIEYSFKTSSFALASLLIALGTPYGIKTQEQYRVPKWIFNCPPWQKRLFLTSLFGAELSKPKTLNKYNFYAPQLNMQKTKELEKNAELFLKDIAKLLKEFNITTYSIKKVPGYRYKGKRGRETVGLRLQIAGEAENLIKFFGTINYEYNQEKHREACLAANYLKRKLGIVKIRSKAREEIKRLYQKRGDFKKLAPRIIKKYNSKYVSSQFLYHSLFKENSHGVVRVRGNPRIAFNFPSFKEYKNKNSYGNKGLVWEKIEKIEKVPYADFVYDFTISDVNHNFIANNFVVSNCGMKLLKSEYSEKEIKPYLDKLATEIQKEVPSGLGRGRKIKLSIEQINRILEGGVPYLVKQGYGEQEDVENCEAKGSLSQADASAVSERAKNRGRNQVGTLGSGNHFLEIQKVEEIFDEKVAELFGLFKNQLVIMIHTGSRGFGHQVATDYIKEFMGLMEKYKIRVPDREFACVPFNSSEGQRYFAAMGCGANFAWANRHMISHYVKEAWRKILGEKEKLTLLYDVAHNIIKKEKYLIDGQETEVAVHRKGATRAFPPGHPEVPERYREVGQPVIIPGTMGTASYVLAGTEKSKEAWHSVCHGAGRRMSRRAATRKFPGSEVVQNLEDKGIIIKYWGLRGIAEEAPMAYKDVNSVVQIVHNAGLAKKVAKLVPLAVIKGE